MSTQISTALPHTDTQTSSSPLHSCLKVEVLRSLYRRLTCSVTCHFLCVYRILISDASIIPIVNLNCIQSLAGGNFAHSITGDSCVQLGAHGSLEKVQCGNQPPLLRNFLSILAWKFASNGVYPPSTMRKPRHPSPSIAIQILPRHKPAGGGGAHQ
jgi:hypothetical protein